MPKISFKIVFITAAIFVAAYEVRKVDFNSDNEKYINSLQITNGLILSIRDNDLKNIDRYLGYKKLKINTQTNNGSTPLLEAIMNKDLNNDYFEKILYLSDVNLISSHGYAPIHIAITSHDLNKVQLITSHPNFNPKITIDNKNIIDFAIAFKNNTKKLQDRLYINNIISYLSNKYSNLLDK